MCERSVAVETWFLLCHNVTALVHVYSVSRIKFTKLLIEGSLKGLFDVF